jgi:3-hydroxymyristoyl/3-hydroxydecanoyl-(acyl carrier protein) dehydratase
MVMPGTLMYECCAHTLRVFLQRLGWVTEKPGVYYEPYTGVESTLKCRGPVTPETLKVLYEVEIKEIGYMPQPYVIADAHMFADGHRIVYFKDLSMQMTGITREEIESFWETRRKPSNQCSRKDLTAPVFDRDRLLEFANGSPSKAFGAPYACFDNERFIARLPAPPYLFMDRVVGIEPEPWILKPDGWIEAQYDVCPDAWYFSAERSFKAPISVILEIALQPCGWLAAYMGSALKRDNDLRFRNLGGRGTIYRELPAEATTLTVNARMTQVSEAGDMIIEHFEFDVRQQDREIYTGNTYFGFFTVDALAQQEGIRDKDIQVYRPTKDEMATNQSHVFHDEAPLHPQDPNADPAPAMAFAAKALRMIDRIDIFIPDGGPHGLGFIRGTKVVDPAEWFFRAHFYQDPVCPGSLGIESFIQLLKYVARRRWSHLIDSHRFGLWTDKSHSWTYRGQITPHNQAVTVEAVITSVQDNPIPILTANGILSVDGLIIYKMENYGIQLAAV